MIVNSPVQLFLFVLAIVALCSLPLVGVAPNRILTPEGVSIFSLLQRPGFFVLLGLGLSLAVPVFLRSSRFSNSSIYLISCAVVSLAAYLIGDYATEGMVDNARARYSAGACFWVLCLVMLLMATESSRRLVTLTWQNSLAIVAFFLPIAVIIATGHLNDLSIAKEYFANRDTFITAFAEHLTIVGTTVMLTLIIGLLLGIQCYFKPRFGAFCLSLLSLTQTIPSIAIFGLLLAPLSALANSWPWLAALGVSGIGATPAIIALLLYSLLPMVRSTVAGLNQVSPTVLDAATGIGMSPSQILWQVHLRLSLPIILSGLRVTTIQAIGLTMVAALIGAGGFGAIMFRGLSSSAIDLVFLGVLPVIILSAMVDAVFKIVVQAVQRFETRQTDDLAF